MPGERFRRSLPIFALMKRGSSIPVLLCLLVVVASAGCKHEPASSALDSELLELARASDGHVWYRFSDSLLPRSPLTGHGEAFLRTRYDPTAAALLDSTGKVLPDTTFPEGALIVKELWEDQSTLGTFAVLLKRPSDPAADANGWVWGYIRANGEVRNSALDKGSACRGCHGQAGSIDASLMNLSFP